MEMIEETDKLMPDMKDEFLHIAKILNEKLNVVLFGNTVIFLTEEFL